MNPCELTASITAIANVLACKLSIDEISLLASSFVQLGDTLATIALQKTLCENAEENSEECHKKRTKDTILHVKNKEL